jgi:two-component system, NarL family, sensor histidine kinase DegS
MLDVLESPDTCFAQETERRRIARELHDSAVQSLTALIADLEYFRTRYLTATNQANHEVAAKIETWQELARDSLISMRQTLRGLRSHTDLEFGLEPAVSTILTDLCEAGYHVVYECTDWPTILPFEYTSNLYCMVREALTNICKHAQASTIRIYMFTYEGYLHISIRDDGIGMPAQSTPTTTHSGYHQGLIGMRERAALLHGQLSIESNSGRGTRIDIDVPLPW